MLIFAPAPGDARLAEQTRRLSRHGDALRERDIAVIEVAGDRVETTGRTAPDAGALRTRFAIPEEAFAVILVGKDGGEKLRRMAVVDAWDIFDLIDTMPMRRREMIRQGQMLTGRPDN